MNEEEKLMWELKDRKWQLGCGYDWVVPDFILRDVFGVYEPGFKRMLTYTLLPTPLIFLN